MSENNSSQANNWFETWFDSPYYHILYKDRDDSEAQLFMDNLTQYLNVPDEAKILDLACGKGRHAIYLNQLGYDVTGVDLSENSIAEASKSSNDSLRFKVHDMRQPTDEKYDAVFNLFTSFGYFKTRREHDNAIRTIAQSIKPGGFFVMDYLNTHFAEDHIIHQSEKEVDGINFIITKWFDETHFYKKIIVEDEALQEPLIFTERVAKFSLGDFTEMFAYQGLQIQEVFGDYNFSNYDVKKSSRLINIAKKVS